MTKKFIKSFFSYWENQPKNREYILTWAKRIPCVWDEGMLVDKYQLFSPEQIEAAVRDYLYHNLNWTGTQDPGNAYIDSPVDLLRWYDERKDLNNGAGPTWSCGPFAVVYVGILAAFGVSARRVWSSSYIDGFQDNVAEYWSDVSRRWVLVIPHLNMHFELAGRKLNCFQWAASDRRDKNSYPVTISGTGKPKFSELDLNAWRGMSGNPCVMRGNDPHAGGSAPSPDRWQYFQIMPKIGQAIDHELFIPHGSFQMESYLIAPKK